VTQPAQQTSYAEAYATAAALYVAAQAAQAPDSEEDGFASLAATIRAATAAIGRAQASAAERITQRWRSTSPYDDREVANFAVDAGRVMTSTQQVVARVTAASQTAAFQAAGARIVVAQRVPDDVRTLAAPTPDAVEEPRRRTRVRVTYDDGSERTVAREEATNTRVFERVAETYRYSRSRGRTHEQATQAAENRVATIVDGNLQAVRARVEYQAMTQTQTVDLDRTVVGYRRIIHPEMSMGGVCGMCVVAADRMYTIETLKAIHHLCKCTVLPVFEDYDPGRFLNRQDLDALYAAAGGNTNRRLKRTRYKVVEHAELGPMLVPEKGSPVPYFPVPADPAA
jgi:hypothetical protein